MKLPGCQHVVFRNERLQLADDLGNVRAGDLHLQMM